MHRILSQPQSGTVLGLAGLLVACVAVVLATVGSASAGGGAKQEGQQPVAHASSLNTATKSVSVPDGDVRQPIVYCPQGQQAVSGGALIGGNRTIIFQSEKWGANAWRVGGENPAGNPSGRSVTLRARVYCKAPGQAP